MYSVGTMLEWTVMLALGAFSAIQTIRILLAGRPIAERKPIACDLCLSTWTALLGAAAALLAGEVDIVHGVALWPATTALSMFALRGYDALIPIARLPE